jgi:hypothetical protein
MAEAAVGVGPNVPVGRPAADVERFQVQEAVGDVLRRFAVKEKTRDLGSAHGANMDRRAYPAKPDPGRKVQV